MVHKMDLVFFQMVILILESSVVLVSSSEDDIFKQHHSDEECSFLFDSMNPSTNLEECTDFLAGSNAPLILISLDGFRPEYLSRTTTDRKNDNERLAAPTINCLAHRGVSAPYMMPSYPTITFPNHYSIITGLYPESHEIISNQFYDPDLKANFSIRNGDATDPKWWDNGEPIWTTVRKQGKISATYFWPGSDVNFPPEQQRTPNYFFKYNKNTSFKIRVDQVLKWMDLPSGKRPSITTLYFEEPDSTGHKTGPNTSNVTEKVAVVDKQIRRLIDGLVERNISNCVNIIIVSDHGMADSPSGHQLVELSRYIPDVQESTLTFYGPVTSIRPLNESREEEVRIGSALSCKNERMRVFKKWELPYRMHSARSRRIPKFMLDMDLGWRGVFDRDPYTGNGAHGWDNLYLEMQAVFLAYGPSFKRSHVVRPFENIQLYNLMCALVNVTPAENNGTWGALHHFLNEPIDLTVDVGQDFPEMPPILHATNETNEVTKGTSCSLLNGHRSSNETSLFVTNIMSEERENELLSTHAPLGIPVDTKSQVSSDTSNASHVLLVNNDYLSGFDTENGLPLWTAYTTYGKTRNGSTEGEWIDDPRLESNHTGSCQRLLQVTHKQNVIYTHLFPEEFATQEGDAWLDTNLLEVPSKISQLITAMNEILAEATETGAPLHVISGPTRHSPAALFYVVTACNINATITGEWNITTCPIENRDLQAFILPVEQPVYQTCISDREYIAFNVATLKDVEDVTEFYFFPDLPIEDKLNLVTRTTLDSRLLIDPSRRPS